MVQGALVNERNTENLVRDELRRLGYYDKRCETRVEEQKSEIQDVKRLLKAASKTGGGGKGAPEFCDGACRAPEFPGAGRHPAKCRRRSRLAWDAGDFLRGCTRRGIGFRAEERLCLGQ